MKIGVIGIGNIATKAFLPLYLRMNDSVEWIIYSRTPDKAAFLKRKYNFSTIVDSIEALLEANLDACMVHSPTHTHYEVIQTLLNHNVHVYVDKPISENYEECLTLIHEAKARNRVLFTGFNRRYAPFVEMLKDKPKNRVSVIKNRINEHNETKFALYDNFIHALDTAIYLMNEPVVSWDSWVDERDGILIQAEIRLVGKNVIAHAVFNAQAGSNTETVEINGIETSIRVENLSRSLHYKNEDVTVNAFNDWTGTLYKRGFTSMLDDFVACVQSGCNSSIVTLDSARFVHQLIHEMVIKHTI